MEPVPGAFGLAFLGCGGATRMHSRTLRRVEGAPALYYASRDLARAEEFSGRHGGAGAFGSYEAAMTDPRVHAVLVATPPASHLELTLAALRHQKHVILEKPPLLRSADFEEVAAAADAAGRRVMVAENYFYKPLLEALRKALAAGEIGEPRIVHVSALKEQRTEGNWRDQEELAGGGALFEGGIHWVSFMASLGLDVERVHGFLPARGDSPERTAVAVFEYAGGAVGTLYHSWELGSPLKGLRLSAIYGTDGTATFESNGLGLVVRGRRRRLAMPDPRDLLGYRGMFEDFFAALREGREARYTLALARRDLSLVEQILASAGSRSTTEGTDG